LPGERRVSEEGRERGEGRETPGRGLRMTRLEGDGDGNGEVDFGFFDVGVDVVGSGVGLAS
jgi:hypothetical protein